MSDQFYKKLRNDTIAEFEGFEPNAYQVDGEDFYTIGYGNTYNEDGSPIRPNQTVTREQAYGMMDRKADQYQQQLMQDPDFAALSPQAQTALSSFSYNSGPNWIGHPGYSTLTDALRRRDEDALKDSIMMYTNPGTSVEAGLVKRRKAEQDIFEVVPEVPTQPKPGMVTISPTVPTRPKAGMMTITPKKEPGLMRKAGDALKGLFGF